MVARLARADPLRRYVDKRDFEQTSEPKGIRAGTGKTLSFVVQKHDARRLHYDFRLELDGVLLSWAVPKGPSYDPAVKRMAVHVEDHPVSYGGFEGRIPAGQYGAGTVIVWDHGTWEPVGDARKAMATGKLQFRLHGEKLAGLWELVRIARPGERQDTWLLFKKRDDWAQRLGGTEVVSALPDSVIAKPLGPMEAREAPPRKHAGATSRPMQGETPAQLDGAVKAALPDILKPQLATLVKEMPSGGDWLHEIKFDGYRIMARITKGRVRLITRGGHDWTGKLTALVREVKALGLRSGWLDGEIVVLGSKGTPDFNALQNAFDSAHTAAIIYFVFDAPFFEGYDLRKVPLQARRELLKRLFDAKGTPLLRFSEDFPGDAASVMQSACRIGLEGVIAKRRDAPYMPGRSANWLKLKCSARQEFVIVGYTERSDARNDLGGLLLGYYEGGELRYAGKVGTGWDTSTRADLRQRLSRIETDRPGLDVAGSRGRWSGRAAGAIHWVRPALVAEIRFAEWTPEGHVRHASFVGLRADKPARQIGREVAQTVAARPYTHRAAAAKHVGAVKVSHADRVIDPSSGLTKLDLVRYYEFVADRMLPHLKARPVSLLRAPKGVTGQQFFQKHDDRQSIRGLRELDPALWPGHAGLIAVPHAKALVAAAQMNVMEFHTWNSTARSIGKPDRIIFDLDPGEGVAWQRVREAALAIRILLAELELQSWLKTSGGKGLHVVVPLAPRLDYETVKDFSQAVVRHLARTIPSRFVAKSGGSNRVGKVFVDYLRNGFSQTTAAAFSARARPGLGVSMPVAWAQLEALSGGAQWNIVSAPEYLAAQKDDPWAGYWTSRQGLSAARRRIAEANEK